MRRFFVYLPVNIRQSLAVLLSILFWCGSGLAQNARSDSSSASRGSDFYRVPPNWRRAWDPLFGSFLEPNRFATAYDRQARYLRLEAGFGAPMVAWDRGSIGAECLIWSGLKTLSDFRFPVETADYFFGINSFIRFPRADLGLQGIRLRLSHISSHWVDGVQDSIVGGSSSKYSREFASAEGEFSFGADYPLGWTVRASAGAKAVFHQVTKVEPTIQIPIAVEYRPVGQYGALDKRGLMHEDVFSLSDCAGAYYPLYSAALIHRITSTDLGAVTDVYLEYHDGATRYGAKAGLKERGFEIGLRLHTILLGD